MGCFNVTCAISGLSITQGDRCYGIIVRGGVAFLPRIFSPLIVGDYNDYGSLDTLEESDLEEITLKYFNKELKSGRMKYSGVSTEENNIAEEGFISMEAILCHISYGEVEYGGENLAIVFILKDVADHLISKITEKSFYHTESSFEEAIKKLKSIFDLNKEYSRLLKEKGFSDPEVQELRDKQLDNESPALWYGVNFFSSLSPFGGLGYFLDCPGFLAHFEREIYEHWDFNSCSKELLNLIRLLEASRIYRFHLYPSHHTDQERNHKEMLEFYKEMAIFTENYIDNDDCYEDDE